MRTCVVYDCLYPWTVGGAERWLRSLCEFLVREGDRVTYLTRKQWPNDSPPRIPGVHVVAACGRAPLYDENDRRSTSEALRFGYGVFSHLIRNRNSYDVVHVTAAPLFGVIGAWLATVGRGPILFVDWDEAWTRDYWLAYAGPITGRAGWWIQKICIGLSRRAFIKTELHTRRLLDQGLRGKLVTLTGLYEGGPTAAASDAASPPTVLFAGRLIPEKRALAIPEAVAAAREQIPDLQAKILGEGPDRQSLLEKIERMGAERFVVAPGFVESAELEELLSSAACLVLPSSREGFGIIVVEAAAHGTPAVLVAGPDNAATEHIREGVNGFVAVNASPENLGDAIVKAIKAGDRLRGSTHAWFSENYSRLSVSGSAATVRACHADAVDAERDNY